MFVPPKAGKGSRESHEVEGEGGVGRPKTGSQCRRQHRVATIEDARGHIGWVNLRRDPHQVERELMIDAEEEKFAQHVSQLSRLGFQAGPGMNKAHVVHIYVNATAI